jgi:transcriptional regulator with XRE-family HTH domain
MEPFAVKIRNLRLGKGDPLRKVASYLDIDQAILSKIETGKRTATRENVLKLEEYYGMVPGTLLVLWLSDRIISELREEELAIEVINLSEKRAGYPSIPVIKELVIKKVKEHFLDKDTEN